MVNKTKDTENNKWVSIGVAIIGAVAIIIVGYWQTRKLDSPPMVDRVIDEKSFSGRVIEELTEKKIRGAKVILEIQNASPVTYTDTEGMFSFPIKKPDEEVRIRVEAGGYENFDQRINPSSQKEILEIRIKPIAAKTQTEPEKFTARVKKGRTAKLFNDDLFITLSQITNENRIEAVVSSPGYPDSKIQNQGAGYRFPYHGRRAYDIQILNVTKTFAELVVMRN